MTSHYFLHSQIYFNEMKFFFKKKGKGLIQNLRKDKASLSGGKQSTGASQDTQDLSQSIRLIF